MLSIDLCETVAAVYARWEVLIQTKQDRIFPLENEIQSETHQAEEQKGYNVKKKKMGALFSVDDDQKGKKSVAHFPLVVSIRFGPLSSRTLYHSPESRFFFFFSLAPHRHTVCLHTLKRKHSPPLFFSCSSARSAQRRALFSSSSSSPKIQQQAIYEKIHSTRFLLLLLSYTDSPWKDMLDSLFEEDLMVVVAQETL